jgi:SNF2 family DNA or RNA helicase
LGSTSAPTNAQFLAAHSSSVFEILTRLRQACCSGALVPAHRIQRAEQVLQQLQSKSKAGQALTAEEAIKLLEKLKGALSDDGAPKDPSDEPAAPECAICVETLTEDSAVVLRRCGHVFCHDCLEMVASSKTCYGNKANNCPFCRLSFVENDMVPWKAAAQAADAANEGSDGNSEELAFLDLGPPPKLEALLASMAEMKEGEKCVIFSQFTKFLDEIGPFLESQGKTFLRIDGSKTQAQRQQALSAFSDSTGSPGIMLCSLHAAGTGINLTRANHIFMMDTWWNKAVETQAFDRVHR